MFNVLQYQNLYSKFLGPLAQEIGIRLNNGTDFDPPVSVSAHVSRFKESDLVPDGSIMIGDIKLIILYSDLPGGMRDLEIKDRIEIEGRSYAVVQYDKHTRSIGDVPLAVQAAVRG